MLSPPLAAVVGQLILLLAIGGAAELGPDYSPQVGLRPEPVPCPTDLGARVEPGVLLAAITLSQRQKLGILLQQHPVLISDRC